MSASSNTNTNVPGGIITQVRRPTDEDGEEQGQGVTYTPARRGFFEACCCCFLGKAGVEPRDDDAGEEEEESDEEQIITPTEFPNDPDQPPLLPPLSLENKGKKTLVLDLDETLVHSSFKPIPNPDFIVPVEIEDIVHKVYVLKRPGVDKFLKELGPVFEVVVFTASLSKYADPVLDLLDIHKVVQHRLFRESCSTFKGNYVKDLARLGRDLAGAVIIDNSPSSYIFSQDNAIGCESWFDDPNDTELLDLIPFLLEMNRAADVRDFLADARQRDFQRSE